MEAIETREYQALIDQDNHYISLLANTSAFIMEKTADLNWAGFYLATDKQLTLGPFQGKTACNRIAFNRGVCGKSYQENKTVVVDDVHQFPGHIACDAASLSECVIPVHNKEGEIIAVLDLDSPLHHRFDPQLVNHLEAIIVILEEQLKKID